LMLAIMLVTGLMEDADAYVDLQPVLRLSALLVISYLLLNGPGLRRNGQTLGKRWMSLRIESARDSNQPGLGWGCLLLRGFGLLLIVLLLSLVVGKAAWLLLLFDPLLVFTRSRRSLRDYLAGTRVSREPGTVVTGGHH